MKWISTLLIAAVAMTMVACGGPDGTGGGVSADEARALNEAAAMLDARAANASAALNAGQQQQQ